MITMLNNRALLLLLLAVLPLLTHSDIISKGLVLDLDANHGLALEEHNRVRAWTNQVSTSPARVFLQQDEGREIPGSGRPTLKPAVAALGGHNTLVFQRQELINHEEDTFDRLTTGNGYTWIAVLRVYPQVSILKDVNSLFGNLRNGGHYEGFWAGFTDDNRLWAGSRNGLTFGRWDSNNPLVLGPQLEEDRYHLVAGRMGAGTGLVQVDLYLNGSMPVASHPFPVNPHANPSRMAIGQERDAINHPGAESFDGELARFLLYDRPVSNHELETLVRELSNRYQLRLPR
jgi:hypothetical protein